MDYLEPVVEEKVKAKRQRKPKAVKLVEPEPVQEPELEPLPEPEPLPELEPVFIPCEGCGEPIVFTDAEMNIYRKINAHKRKLMRLKKSTADV